MEPGTQRIAHPEAAGLLHQDEEGRLEGVLRIVGVGQLARQTRNTIAPWRSTSAAKASSAGSPSPRANRSSNCPSVSSRIAPMLKKRAELT